MPVPVDAPMAQFCDLPDGYIVQFDAVDPTSGATVAGVVVRDVSIFGTKLDVTAEETFGPFKLVPGPGA